MMPIERTLAGERTPPRQKGISLGEVQNSRGMSGGTTESPTNRTFSACATQLRFRLTLRTSHLNY